MQNFIICPNLNKPDLSENNLLFKLLPVIVKDRRDRRISGTHWHDYLQIWYTVSGTYRHTLNGKTFTEGPGSIVFVYPYMPHCIDTSQSDLSELSLISISVRKDAFQKYCIPFLSHTYCTSSFDSYHLYHHTVFTGKDKIHVDQLCADISSEFNKQADMQANRLLNMISSLLEFCVNNAERAISPRERSAICNRNACIEEAMSFLKENSSHNISLDDVSKAAMMSRRSFTANFYSTIGKTTHSYLTSLRMKNAIDMLRKTRKGITQVAEESGFCGNTHFWQKCMEIYGVPPNTLRRELSQWQRDYGDELFQTSVKELRWAHVIDEEIIEYHQCSLSFY